MEPFTSHRGILATLNRANVDTDQIIPKQFLKSIKRTGFGESLFFDWRYGPDGSPDPAFELNAPAFAGASILVTRNNFGCGSSREHAVWACAQYGLRAIVAPFRGEGDQRIPGFADIFRNNSVKNGLLTIELTEDEVERIFRCADRHPGLEATVDLAGQRVILHRDEAEETFHFDIDPGVKDHLSRGLDDIALTLKHADAIAAFEARHDHQLAAD
jgi:3-isopropylmalate/(R)-2-methylmalate dehydratase small subunit